MGLQNLPGQPAFLPVKAVTVQAPLILTNNGTPLDQQTNLTLKQAVYLGLKHNTALLTGLNNRQLQRFDLITAKQQFEPKFSLSSTARYSKTESSGSSGVTTKDLNFGPGVTWQFPLGTSITSSLTYNPSQQPGTNGYKDIRTSYSISVTQPLLKGFGTKINEVALDNAYDQQVIDDLNLRKTVQSTLMKIVNDYYAVVAAKQSYNVSKNNLKHAKLQHRVRVARLKAGQIPRTDVTQSKINLYGIEQSLDTAAESLQTAKATLLNDLGLPPNTLFHVDDLITAHKIDTNLEKSIKTALANNLDLKVESLTEKQDQRNILTSQNKRLWQLDLIANKSRSRLNKNNTNISTANNDQISDNTSVAIKLTIPLDRVSLDKDELSSAISLENQKYARQQQHRTIINNIVAATHNLQRAWSQYQVSEDRLKLSEQTDKAAKIQYQYGKINAFALQQQEESLITAQNNLINQRIAYLKQTMSYRQLEGTLIAHWNINVEARKT